MPARSARGLRPGAQPIRAGVAIAVIATTIGCVPRARPLAGAPAPATARLPRIDLAPGPERVVFRWRYEEPGFSARGEGAARTVGPDSARLDFFLDGGFGGGWAVLVGNELRTPPDNVARRLIPPTPLLWAALGRLAVPAGSDTTLRASGDTLRADVALAGGTAWRVTLAGGALVGVDRVQAGRITDQLTRTATTVRYVDRAARRTLAIDVERRERVGPFPEATWVR